MFAVWTLEENFQTERKSTLLLSHLWLTEAACLRCYCFHWA